MNEQVLIEAINTTGQQLAQAMIDKNIVIAELNIVRQENEKLKQEIDELKQSLEKLNKIARGCQRATLFHYFFLVNLKGGAQYEAMQNHC